MLQRTDRSRPAVEPLCDRHNGMCMLVCKKEHYSEFLFIVALFFFLQNATTIGSVIFFSCYLNIIAISLPLCKPMYAFIHETEMHATALPPHQNHIIST